MCCYLEDAVRDSNGFDLQLEIAAGLRTLVIYIYSLQDNEV